MRIPFCGPTYEGRSKNFDASRCINFFPEITKSRETKNQISLVGTFGTKPYLAFGIGEVRMLYNMVGRLFTVVGNCLYEVYAQDRRSSIPGVFPDDTGDVFAADNGIKAYGIGGDQLMMISNSKGYIYNIGTNVFTQIPTYESNGSRTTFPLYPSTVTYQDGYFIVTDDSMGIYVSGLYDGLSWPALATAPVIATSDPVQRAISVNQQLYIIKSWSTEVWYNAGVATYAGCPFARSPGYVFPYGTPAPNSIAYGLDTLLFLANQGHQGASEFSGVVMLQGSVPTAISTPAIDYRICQFTAISDARGYFYIYEGHPFYVLTFPSDDATLVYDLSTQMWHEWSTSIGTDSFVHRHLSNHYVHFDGKHLVADYRSPSILELSSKYYTDNGTPIISTRITPTLADTTSGDSIFLRRLVIDVEGGVGINEETIDEDITWLLDGSVLLNGSRYLGGDSRKISHNNNPQAYLSWSSDSGHTWSNTYPATIGRQGEYTKRLVWKNLGRARNRVFNLTIADSVKKVVLGAYLND